MVPAVAKKRVFNFAQGFIKTDGGTLDPCGINGISYTSGGSMAITMDWRSASVSTRPWGYRGAWKAVTPYEAGSYNLSVSPIRSTTNSSPSLHCLAHPYNVTRQHVLTGGYLDSFTIPGPLDPPLDTDNVAKARVLAKIVSEETSDLALAFAERQQTANLLGTTATRIAKSARKLKTLLSPRSWKRFLGKPKERVPVRGTELYRQYERRKSTKYFDKHGRDVSRHVLEVQYGWKPLMQDLESSLNVIERRQIDNEFRFSKKSRVETRRQESFNLPCASEGSFNATRIRNWTVRYKIWYELRTDLLGTLAAAGLVNLAAVAWDRVPFSFIIDWFFTAGQWLRNFGVGLAVNFLDGLRSTKLFISDVVSTPSVIDPWAYHATGGGVVNLDYQQYSRVKLYAFPSSKPYWKNPVSLTHMLNGLALIGALIGGSSTRASRL